MRGGGSGGNHSNSMRSSHPYHREGEQSYGEPQSPDNTVFIGNLENAATSKHLEDLFVECGPIKSIRRPRYFDTGKPKGFAFVEFYDSKAASKALSMNGVELLGRVISVKHSHITYRNLREKNKYTGGLFDRYGDDDDDDDALNQASNNNNNNTHIQLLQHIVQPQPQPIQSSQLQALQTLQQIALLLTSQQRPQPQSLNQQLLGSLTLQQQQQQVAAPSSRVRPVSVRPPGCKTIFVGTLPESATESTIRQLFGSCGTITDIRFLYDKATGEFKQCCFVDFKEESGPPKAVAFNGVALCGRPLRVDYMGPNGRS